MNGTQLMPVTQARAGDGPPSALPWLSGDACGAPSGGLLVLPSGMPCFERTGLPEASGRTVNWGTRGEPRLREERVLTIPGRLTCWDGLECSCPVCGARLRGNGSTPCLPAHTPIGDTRVRVRVERPRLRCPSEGCGYLCTCPAPFKAEGHMVTVEMLGWTEKLLALGHTLKAVARLTGLDQGTVKSIDLERLRRLYTVAGPDGKRALAGPDRQARRLGIDEFKLHDGRRFATVVIDLDTGEALWLAHGRKKRVVRDFVEHVGPGWMAGVEAVACDMNSDYEEEFRELCPHLDIVFDRFHIVKYLNDSVVSPIRKDIQAELREAGDEEAARSLKGSRWLLTAKRSTIDGWEKGAAEGEVVARGGELFGGEEVRRRAGAKARYEGLIASNELLLACDVVKTRMEAAYGMGDRAAMRAHVLETASICRASGDRHLGRFARLLEGHIDGIDSHAKHRISSGRVEGTNNLIKTLRRQGYGYPDDDYFFLKIFDATRRERSF